MKVLLIFLINLKFIYPNITINQIIYDLGKNLKKTQQFIHNKLKDPNKIKSIIPDVQSSLAKSPSSLLFKLKKMNQRLQTLDIEISKEFDLYRTKYSLKNNLIIQANLESFLQKLPMFKMFVTLDDIVITHDLFTRTSTANTNNPWFIFYGPINPEQHTLRIMIEYFKQVENNHDDLHLIKLNNTKNFTGNNTKKIIIQFNQKGSQPLLEVL